jgi:signal transduction histidine kinase/CheY-like chemotaxis protein
MNDDTPGAGARRSEEHPSSGPEAKLRSLLAAVADTVLHVGSDGVVLEVVHGAGGGSGPFGGCAGRDVREVLPADAAERVVRCLGGATRDGAPEVFEFRLEAAQRDYQARVAPCGEGEALAVVRDVTERRRAAEERDRLHAARVEAERANRAKDQFLATVSHELRTPLNTISGWVSLLRYGKLDEGTAARAVESIERNVEAQAKILEDLLDVSRIISGKVRLEPQTVDLTAVVAAAVEAARPVAESEGLRLVADLRAGAPQVLGDPDRLRQVVSNLLSNAVKFTPSGGTVGVQLQEIGGRACLTVKDTGIGMSPQVLPHVFERFRQADSSLTRKYSGLGLGLAIVRHLVELHGGSVKAASEGEGKGSTFVVTLPLLATRPAGGLATETLPDGGGAPEVRPELEGVRVLVVDDEADSREVLAEALARYGVEVRACGSAREALDALAEWRPDVLISDIAMPGEDGYSLLRKARAREPDPRRRIPAVALTAYTRAEDRERARASGYEAHLAKPVDMAQLVETLARLAGRGRQ